MLIYKERPNWTEEECKQFRRDKIAKAIWERALQRIIYKAKYQKNKEYYKAYAKKKYATDRVYREKAKEYQRQYRLRKKAEREKRGKEKC